VVNRGAGAPHPGQGLQAQRPEDDHEEATGGCGDRGKEGDRRGGWGCQNQLQTAAQCTHQRRGSPVSSLTQLQRGEEPGAWEGVEGRLVENVEDDVEGVPGVNGQEGGLLPACMSAADAAPAVGHWLQHWARRATGPTRGRCTRGSSSCHLRAQQALQPQPPTARALAAGVACQPAGQQQARLRLRERQITRRLTAFDGRARRTLAGAARDAARAAEAPAGQCSAVQHSGAMRLVLVLSGAGCVAVRLLGPPAATAAGCWSESIARVSCVQRNVLDHRLAPCRDQLPKAVPMGSRER
jgi:hypothetical protein